MRTGQSHAFIG